MGASLPTYVTQGNQISSLLLFSLGRIPAKPDSKPRTFTKTQRFERLTCRWAAAGNTALLQARREKHPSGDTTQVEHLIAADQQDRKIRRLFALLEMFVPPTDRIAGVDQNVKHGQHHTSDPSKNQTEEHTVDQPMHPSCRMRETDFVDGHPFILKQPISNEMNHQSCLKGSQGHSRLIRTVPHAWLVLEIAN